MKKTIRNTNKIFISTIFTALLCVVGVLVIAACVDDSNDTTTYDYICANGTPVNSADDKPDKEGVTKCASCEDGFVEDGNNACVTGYNYVCPNGTKADGQSAQKDTPKCTSCNTAQNYLLVGEACELFSISTDLALSGTATANNATLTITASHAATVHWVVYAAGTTKGDAATVISDAGDTNIGIDRSGSAGQSATAGNPAQLSVSGLSPTTSYVAYAAVTSTANDDIVLLSEAVTFTTSVEGVATFTTQPTASNITQTDANITLVADENASLYWVLYASEQTPAPTAAQLEAAALDGVSGVERSGDNQSVTATNTTTISLGGTVNLTPLEDYYFYALIVDGDDNQTLSAVASFTTTGYDYTCPNGTPVAPTVEQSTTQNAVKCTACTTANYQLVGEACELFQFDANLALTASSVTANHATLTVTASHDAKVHWVVYPSGTTKSSATAVVTDAGNDSVGLDRSGMAGQSADGGMQEELSVSGLSPDTSYVAYAVITSTANSNLALLSSSVTIITNQMGLVAFSSQPTEGTKSFTSASVNFTANEDADIYWVLYASQQTPAPTAAQLEAAAKGGSSGTHRSGSGQTVTGGMQASAGFGYTPTPPSLTPAATYYFYALLVDEDGNQALSDELTVTPYGYDYICPGGTKAGGQASSTNTVKCTACNTSHLLISEVCEQFEFNNAPAITANTIMETTAKATATASHDATLYWVAFTEGNSAISTATTTQSQTVTAAQVFVGYAKTQVATNPPGVIRGSTSGIDLTADNPQTFNITGLTAGTDYVLYVGMESDVGMEMDDDNEVVIKYVFTESPVEFTTASSIEFTAQPALVSGSEQAIQASFTVTSSQNANLYWIAYTSGATAPTAANLIAAVKAGSGGGTGVQARGSSSGIAVTAGNPKEFDATGLPALQDLDLYVALESTANTSSVILGSKVDFSTTGHPFVCSNGQPTPGTTNANQGVVSCASCKDGFGRNTNASGNPCVACVGAFALVLSDCQ